MSNKIAAVIVEKNKEPYVKEIDTTLESLQYIVSGDIEYVPLYEYPPLHIYCNEEGKFNGSLPNRTFYSDVLYGTFIVLKGDDEGNEASLNPEEIKMVIKLFALDSDKFKPC
jgi:hypothetical protein